MKIAVATEDGTIISSHFGRSPWFAVYKIEDDKIIEREMRKNTFTGHFRAGHRHHYDTEHVPGSGDGHGHHSVGEGLKDCNVVISNGMGRKAWEDLRKQGIEMIVTDESDIEKAVVMYLAGELKDKTERLH